jgi:hypothetical protein
MGQPKQCARAVAIERKAGASVERLNEAGSFQIWSKALNEVLVKLATARFRAIVFG